MTQEKSYFYHKTYEVFDMYDEYPIKRKQRDMTRIGNAHREIITEKINEMLNDGYITLDEWTAIIEQVPVLKTSDDLQKMSAKFNLNYFSVDIDKPAPVTKKRLLERTRNWHNNGGVWFGWMLLSILITMTLMSGIGYSLFDDTTTHAGKVVMFIVMSGWLVANIIMSTVFGTTADANEMKRRTH